MAPAAEARAASCKGTARCTSFERETAVSKMRRAARSLEGLACPSALAAVARARRCNTRTSGRFNAIKILALRLPLCSAVHVLEWQQVDSFSYWDLCKNVGAVVQRHAECRGVRHSLFVIDNLRTKLGTYAFNEVLEFLRSAAVVGSS